VRLGTWNVLHAASPADDEVDLDRFATAVRGLDVDVLGLQELDRGQPRSRGADLTTVAAEAMGAAEYRFAPTLVGLPGAWSAAPDQEPSRAPAYGIGLLSRFPVTSWQVVDLPRLPRAIPLLLGRPRRVVVVHDEPRVAVAARVSTPRGPVMVATTHLSFIPGWNLVQLRHLVRALETDGPLVVTGDLNLGARRARVAGGLPVLATGVTFPAHAPRRQLDHLLGRGVVASAARIHHPPVSDHRALSATVVPAD
jgi:endonuclease/exonuclease/phosphatase family metal-dependent hydrolase